MTNLHIPSDGSLHNGIISSHDITRTILTDLIKKGGTTEQNSQFACLRRTCRKWKEMVDSLSHLMRPSYLEEAIRRGSTHSVRFLLTLIDPTPGSVGVINMLFSRDVSKRADILQILLEDGRLDPSDMYKNVISRVNWCTEAVELLLRDHRVDPSVKDNHAIRWASSGGYTQLVRLLLSHHQVDPAAGCNEAIRGASIRGHTDIVKLLLSSPRTDPSDANNLAIIRASTEGHIDIVGLLLKDDRVNPSAENNEAIRRASCRGHAEVVELLLKDSRVRSTLCAV
ncbi:putative ankyrin repeat protein [Planoprotostelium fungivorum]|uniref:Putative ankyrin repeat protein n=1 Tax=Planoprotostelium fungivorum TaxID=1890364 RepID=A0A2P6NMR2_9EUKA|nr:putative ankyrin repeat protein [Planoprotostelium fungivorum]